MPAALPFTQKAWLSQTSVPGRIRSAELRTLDRAVEDYEVARTQANFDKVKLALTQWKRKEGPEWLKSKRNSSSAVEHLDRTVFPQFYPASSSSPGSYEAGLANSRQGLLWLFANTKLHVSPSTYLDVVLDGVFGIAGGVVGLDASGVGGPKLLSDTGSAIGGGLLTAAQVSIGQARDKITRPAATAMPGGAAANLSLLARIKGYFLQFARNVFDSVKAWKSSSAQDKLEDAWSLVTTFANNLASGFWSAGAPFLAGSIDAVEGVGRMVKACYQRYKVYEAGKGIRLNTGHPAVIAKQIETAMNFSIGKGLYQALRGAAAVTAEAITAGAASIATLVASGLEALVKIIHRVFEVKWMKAFFADCHTRYTRMGADAERDPFFKDGVQFAEWYGEASWRMPCLSALAINSHIVGDKMRFINMFTDGSTAAKARSGSAAQGPAGASNVISQKDFDRGVDYLERLKDWSKDYLVEANYTFYSPKSDANAYLNIWNSKAA
jgi:hypothetical protein